MTATDTTMTTASSEAVPKAVASQDAANLPANEGTTPVAKEPAAVAKPAAKAAAKVRAKAEIPVAQKPALAAKPAVKSAARLPTKAAAPVAKKTIAAARPEGKAVSKIPAKPAGRLKATPKASVKQAVSQKAEKVLKEKKPKLVRDSFTIPKAEYMVLDELKQRAGKLGSPIKKSELIRAGIKALAAMSDPLYLEALKVVPTIKTGRPATK